MARTAPLLHRDDPEKDPLVGHVKVTRQDWLNMARDVLVTEGVAEVKILALSERMGVSRSSFYWYFENRSDLLSALLHEWEARNTAQIISQCELRSANITEAVCNFFRCFVDPAKFDGGLDFAVREWSRREEPLRIRVDAADTARIDAVTRMFEAHGFPVKEADARARILYFMQLGYHALEVREPIDLRMSRVKPYMQGFTGSDPDQAALDAFQDYVNSLGME
ncbi:MAG: TetR/AcrR family transcriptional regulator [Pseudomonadota bacterium]